MLYHKTMTVIPIASLIDTDNICLYHTTVKSGLALTLSDPHRYRVQSSTLQHAPTVSTQNNDLLPSRCGQEGLC